jgi:integrase
MEDLTLPEVETVRKRIETAAKKEAKFCLMSAYLFCARASEIIGITNSYDVIHGQTIARGPTGQDVKIETFELGDIKTEAIVFTIRTAKRDGKIRKIALPREKHFEPWTELLYNYYREHGSDKVFPFTRQKAWEYAQETFEGLRYPIEKYNTYYSEDTKTKPVKAHMKPFRTHALRHLRATELIETFGFTGFDLSVYGGWTLRSMVGVGSAMSRYAHLDWRRYFPKLLKKRF